MRRLPPALLALALAACGPKPEAPDAGPVDAGPVDAGPQLPTAASLTPDTWDEIPTGGETVCARGGAYSFFVYPGKVNRVVIDFMGGGACWTAESCSFAGALFDDSVQSLRNRVKNGFPGVYNKANPASPFKDYWHVVVPYCTGDIHWGNNVATYGDPTDGGVTIRHKGAVNARAVLDWVYANFPSPEQILVQGCSAGSYGSILWSAHIQEHYPNIPVRQFGDSGAGVVTDTFFRDSFPQWQATGAAPAFIPELDPAHNDWSALSLPDLYQRIGHHFPSMSLAQFNTANDSTQRFFFTAMGGADADWSGKMLDSIARIQASTPNFRSFVGQGTQHCVLPDDDFATFTTNGVRFVDWLGDQENGRPVQNVQCVDCDGGS